MTHVLRILETSSSDIHLHSHHPSSPTSVKALAMLRGSLSVSRSGAHPLEFNLEVIESKPPTPEQLQTILSYVAKDGKAAASYATFLSVPDAGEPQSAAGIAELGAQNPNALKWPVVVDWYSGRASIGDVQGVADVLQALRDEQG